MRHLFYAGDNLVGLGLIARCRIRVDLVYIDPPFATNREFLVDEDRANTVSASRQTGLFRHDSRLGVSGRPAGSSVRHSRCDVSYRLDLRTH